VTAPLRAEERTVWRAQASSQRFPVKTFLAGRQRVHMEDGTEMEFGPADVAILQPGHDAPLVGEEPNVLIKLADVVKPNP
jgi:uncharacterized cupin superfamily protein